MRGSIANNYRYVKFYFIATIILLVSFSPVCQFSYGAEPADNSQNLFSQLQDNVKDSIADLDLSGIEDYFDENSELFQNVFGFADYKEFLLALVSGQVLADFPSILSAIWAMVKSNISIIISPLILVLVIILLSVLFKNIRPTLNGSSVLEAIFFICFAVVVSLITMLFTNTMQTATQSITKMQNQMNGIFPVLLLLMTSAGASISVKAYQPLVLLLSNIISNVFVNILLPIVVVIFVLCLVGNISPQSKLKNLTDFFSSVFKWVIGIVFTIYMAFLSIQGITASSADGISIKTAKYAIKNYIPLLGGYISDGLEVARVGSVIIKNAIGFSGILFILFTILSPIILIGVLQLALKLIAGFVEPIGDSRACAILTSVSKSLSLLVTVVLGVAIMYFVIIFLLMCSVSGVV